VQAQKNMTPPKYTYYGHACIFGPEDVNRTYYSMEPTPSNPFIRQYECDAVEDRQREHGTAAGTRVDSDPAQGQGGIAQELQDDADKRGPCVPACKKSHKKKLREDSGNVRKSHKKKHRGGFSRNFSVGVKKTLTGYYKQCAWPDTARKIEISHALGMKYQQIHSWFGNHRHKLAHEEKSSSLCHA
jgi:hypothetical protein